MAPASLSKLNLDSRWLLGYSQAGMVVLAFIHVVLQVSRCIPCSEGTYSLNATNPYGCLPCPAGEQGGLCSQGRLIPAPGFFQRNPLLPQVMACPLTKACRVWDDPWALSKQLERLIALHRHRSYPLPVQHDAQQAQRRRLMGAESEAKTSAWSRHLLQTGSADSPAAGGTEEGDGGRLLGAALKAASSNNCSSSAGNLANRTCVLLAMQHSLAEYFTEYHEREVAPTFGYELLAWQQMQCAVGYIGDLCGTCMPGVPPEVAFLHLHLHLHLRSLHHERRTVKEVGLLQ